ncbi:MAG: hypothetical protein AVDCRST_MAG36-2203, partial [uncultured Nocardioidaceae bacterium]
RSAASALVRADPARAAHRGPQRRRGQALPRESRQRRGLPRRHGARRRIHLAPSAGRPGAAVHERRGGGRLPLGGHRRGRIGAAAQRGAQRLPLRSGGRPGGRPGERL